MYSFLFALVQFTNVNWTHPIASVQFTNVNWTHPNEA